MIFDSASKESGVYGRFNIRRARQVSHKSSVTCILSFLIVIWIVQWFWSSGVLPTLPNIVHETQTPFDFANIKPSGNLSYYDCFDGLQCARLEVPLDWNATKGDSGSKVALAIVKRPAKVPVTDPRYGGVVLFNPGGPGGSGVNFFLKYNEQLRTIIDTGEDVSSSVSSLPLGSGKYFDFLSWDPRGVNNTTPHFSCYASQLEQQTWEETNEAINIDVDRLESFKTIWSRSQALYSSCSNLDASGAHNTVNGNEHLGQYVSTASVVRDMVEIVEKHGEWREKVAKKLVEAAATEAVDVHTVLKRTAWRKGEEQLQYWGFSYGTALGQHFATMQPHRVRRMVLDAVVDAGDYIRTDWEANLQDIDQITHGFSVSCYQAGPLECPLWRDGDDGELGILKRINSLLQKLEQDPLPAWTQKGGATIVTKSDVVKMMFNSWYKPMATFKETLFLLMVLDLGDAETFADWKAVPIESFCTPSPFSPKDSDSAGVAIRCGDGDSITQESFTDYLHWVDRIKAQSPIFASRWAPVRLPCVFYNIRAKWRYTGPFGASTSHPILFASQSLDPVTPIRNAYAASKLFPGSAVIESLGMGHATLAMPSTCTAKTIRRYFQTGDLPETGTKCEVDMGPFAEFWTKDRVMSTSNRSRADLELLKAVVYIADNWLV